MSACQKKKKIRKKSGKKDLKRTLSKLPGRCAKNRSSGAEIFYFLTLTIFSGMIAGDRRSLARVLAAQQEANPAEIGNFSIRRTQLVFAWKIAIFPQMKKVVSSDKKRMQTTASKL